VRRDKRFAMRCTLVRVYLGSGYAVQVEGAVLDVSARSDAQPSDAVGALGPHT